MREIRVDPDYIDDPLLLEYLHTVWQPLVAASRSLGNITADIDQRFAWEPFLVRDPSVNAFALPGGFVGVHLGLIAITADARRARLGARPRDVARLAAPHRAQHHRRLEALAGRPGGARPRPARRVAQQQPRRDQRRRRRHAGGDDPGPAQLLARGRARGRPRRLPGHDRRPASRPAAWRRCSRRWTSRSRLNDFGGFPYLRTHPLTVERIGEARARAGIGAAAPRVSVLEHTVAQARARVLMDTRVDALRRWQARDADRDGSAADKLRAPDESALASSLLRDWARADASFAKRAGDRSRQPEQQRPRRARRRADAGAVAARPRRAGAGAPRR